MNDSDSFFGSQRAEKRHESRPRSVNPRTGVEQTWQRASNYASPLDNPHGLIKWQLRELVKGLSRRPDLARMLLTGAAIEDNSAADRIIDQAHATVALDAKANEGTAVHSALSRSFLGHEIPAEYAPHVQAFADELRRNGLQPVATEVRVLCVLLGVIGHTDWIVKTADGRHLILDVKTGKLDDARKFAVQCKAYGASEYIDDGKGGWVPIPFAIDQTEAVLAHVDPETGATSLYRVDLILGLYGATLAERVRDWHKIQVLSPYTPAHHAVPSKGVPHPEHASIAVDTQYGAGLAQREIAEQIPLSSQVEASVQASSGTPIPATNEHGGSAPLQKTRTFDELMKLDKAALQMIVKNDFGGTDLAHHRKWLARWIIAAQDGHDHRAAAKHAEAKDDTPAPMPHSEQGPHPEVPRADMGSTEFVFKAIAGAKSEGAIEALRSHLVERRGDQAWTDEMAAAARARVLELIAADGNAVGPAERTIARITQATEPQHIAALWSEVTIGGSVPGNWTEALKIAADHRMAEIQQSQGAPPANPYGAQ